jgi:teichuronic acid biosynthesis glycosyltransferase TuaC
MTRPLSILVVTNLWPSGGGFRGIFVKEQVESLRSLGHRVDVETVAQSRGRLDYVLAIPRVRRRALAGRYDVIHIHYGLAALAARFCGGTPRILTQHGADVHYRWQRVFTRLGSGGLAERIYVSQRIADLAGRPGTVLQGGVDLALFAPVDRAVARAKLGLDPDGAIVLFGARPDQEAKRYDVFQAVLDTLRARGLTVRELVLAEPGQARSDVPLKFAAADLLLFTSRRGHEGSPTVVKEATVMGLPVVSTDVGDVAQILGDVTPSAVVPFPADWPSRSATDAVIDALAARAERILRDGTRSDGREKNAWLDSTAVAHRLVEIYRRVAA